MEKAELQSQRQAVTSLMSSTEKELERNMALQEKAMDPAEKKLYQGRVDRLTKDLSGYRSALESFSGGRMPEREPDAKPTPPQAAIDFLLKNPDQKDAFIAKYGADAVPQNMDAPAKASTTKAAEPAKPAYTPPADSPAGRAAANREKVTAESNQRSAAELQAVTDAVNAALASKDPDAAMRAQSAPGFGRLDAATKAAIFKLVNGR